jgi:hypothetical protein
VREVRRRSSAAGVVDQGVDAAVAFLGEGDHALDVTRDAASARTKLAAPARSANARTAAPPQADADPRRFAPALGARGSLLPR